MSQQCYVVPQKITVLFFKKGQITTNIIPKSQDENSVNISAAGKTRFLKLAN